MTSSRWSEPLTQTEPKGGTQMELSACIVVYNGAGEAIRAAQTVLDCTRPVSYTHLDVYKRQAYDLKTCKEFMEVHKYADPDTMFRGEIGKLGNIRFIETSEAKIWKDDTCPTGLAVFGTLVLGAHAYGVTELEGGGLEHIVKQLGYGDDPLNQRASVGWKGMRAAERLVEQYMVRIESVSSYSATAAAN